MIKGYVALVVVFIFLSFPHSHFLPFILQLSSSISSFTLLTFFQLYSSQNNILSFGEADDCVPVVGGYALGVGEVVA